MTPNRAWRRQPVVRVRRMKAAREALLRLSLRRRVRHSADTEFCPTQQAAFRNTQRQPPCLTSRAAAVVRYPCVGLPRGCTSYLSGHLTRGT